MVIHQPVMLKDPEVQWFNRDAEFHGWPESRLCDHAAEAPERRRALVVTRQIDTPSIPDRGLVRRRSALAAARHVLPERTALVGDQHWSTPVQTHKGAQ
jgi:hypothetical protein